MKKFKLYLILSMNLNENNWINLGWFEGKIYVVYFKIFEGERI